MSDEKLWLDLKAEISKLATDGDVVKCLQTICSLTYDYDYYSLEEFYGLLDSYEELRTNPRNITYGDKRAAEGGIDKLKEDARHKAQKWLDKYLPENFR